MKWKLKRSIMKSVGINIGERSVHRLRNNVTYVIGYIISHLNVLNGKKFVENNIETIQEEKNAAYDTLFIDAVCSQRS